MGYKPLLNCTPCCSSIKRFPRTFPRPKPGLLRRQLHCICPAAYRCSPLSGIDIGGKGPLKHVARRFASAFIRLMQLSSTEFPRLCIPFKRVKSINYGGGLAERCTPGRASPSCASNPAGAGCRAQFTRHRPALARGTTRGAGCGNHARFARLVALSMKSPFRCAAPCFHRCR